MTKKYDSNRTIQSIIEAASILFMQKGFEKTSMMDIAKEAGISKGAIYHHFKSKDEIIQMVMDLQKNHIEDCLETWLEEMDGFSAKEKLVKLLEKNLQEVSQSPYETVLSTQVKSPEFIVNYMQSCISESAPHFARLIKAGQLDGSITTLFPDECAEAFTLLLNIWCDPIIFASDSDKIHQKLRFIQQMMQSLGVDIVSNQFIEGTVEFLKNLYQLEEL